MDKCIICGSKQFLSILQVQKVPASLSSPPPGKPEVYGILNIVACKDCSHVFNKDFSPEVINQLYAEDYSASLPVSPNVQSRFRNVAENVIGLEHFKDKIVIEVGASDFTFSENLLGYGAKQVIAIEPSAIFTTDNPKIIHIHDYATEEVIKAHFPKADTVVMRHVMEHVTDPVRIINDFAQSLPLGAHFYVEVPNAEDILTQHRPYEFFYEHVSYFSPHMLTSILEACGFSIVKVTPLINGQHFGVLAKKAQKVAPREIVHVSANQKILAAIPGFQHSLATFDKAMRSVLASHKRIAIYGAGGHTISTTARMGLSTKEIQILLDQSPVKVGKLAPQCHIPIVMPTESTVNSVDCIIIIASLHQDEIAKDLRKRWHFKGELFGTYPGISKLE